MRLNPIDGDQMTAKLIDSGGETVFDFDSDAQMRVLLLALLSQAKHGDALRPEITLNPKVDALIEALVHFAERTNAPGFKGADGHFPQPPADVSWSPPPPWARRVLDLLFAEAPALGWWKKTAEEQRALIAQALYPHRLSAETLEEMRDDLDHRIGRYRTD